MHRFSLIAVLALVALASASNDLYDGYRQHGDELIEQKEVTKHWLPFLSVKEELTITGNGKYTITRIEAIDLDKTAKSAKVHIMSGGVGQTYVAFKFKSTKGNGIHFLVKVYGKRAY